RRRLPPAARRRDGAGEEPRRIPRHPAPAPRRGAAPARRARLSRPAPPESAERHAMQANRLPMQRGWAWLKEGALLWRRNPALLTFLAFGYLLILLVISLFPLIGQPIASLLM